MSHVLTWVVIGVALSVSLSTRTPAAVVYVDQNAPGGTNNGASWGTAFLTIQAGVNAAQTGDEVWVANGTYRESVRIASLLALYGGFAGTETALAQRNVKVNVTSILPDASAPGVDCTGASAVVSGFRIRSAHTGVVVNSSADSSLTVTDCDIGGGGKGIAVDGLSAVISRNTIEGGYYGVWTDVSSLVLTGNTISGAGIGVWCQPISFTRPTVTITGNTITGNNQGILLELLRGTVVNNAVAYNAGYGIRAPATSKLYLSCNNVFGNGMANYDSLPDPTGQNGNISADPLLSSIYHDIHIRPDSPCRNTGNGALAATALDLDGQPRIQGAAVDIGADESDGTFATVPTGIWYVRPSGNDGAEGTSWAAAKATVGGALLVARGGDEIWVAKGTYTERISLPAGVALYGGFAGTETSPAQRNIASNATTLQGTSTTESVVMSVLTRSRVDGFTIRGGREGVLIQGDATVANCTVTANTLGVRVEYGSATLTDNFIADHSTDGVSIAYSVVEMQGNLVDWHSGNGISVLAGSYLKLTRNHVQRANQTGLYLEGSARVDADSNAITYHNLAAVWANTGSEINLRNNTIAYGFAGVGVNVYAATAHLANNVIAYHPGYGVRMDGPGAVLTMNSNDVFGNSPDYQTVPPDVQAGNLSVDPVFVDYTNWYFRLLAGSPLIDSGNDSVVVAGDLDRDGKPRIQGAHVDIGAYEYSVPGLLTMQDVLGALRVTGGLSSATSADIPRWNIVEPGLARITLADAVRLARKVAGLEPNP